MWNVVGNRSNMIMMILMMRTVVGLGIIDSIIDLILMISKTAHFIVQSDLCRGDFGFSWLVELHYIRTVC